MAIIKKLDTTINLTTSTNEYNAGKIIEHMCSETAGITYIGERVTKRRIKFIFVRYEGKIYYVSRYFGDADRFTTELKEFKGQLKDTKPVTNYNICLEYRNPEIDSEKCLCLYYKKNELDIAKKIQEVVGKELAYIREI